MMRENAKTPAKYREVMKSLIERIGKNEFEPKGVLPSESELVSAYNVSRITIRKALDELVLQDYVFRHQGKGTFVNKGRVDDSYYKRYTAGLSSIISASGKDCKRVQIQKSIVPAGANGASLGVAEDDDTLCYSRYYLADDTPVFYAESVINHKGFPGLENYDYNFVSISHLIKDDYKGLLYRRDRKIESTKAGHAATYLGVAESDPVLFLTYMSVVNVENKMIPFERATIFARTDVIDIHPEHI